MCWVCEEGENAGRICLLIGMYAVKCLGYQMATLTQFRVGMERVNEGDVSFRGHLVIFFSLWLEE